MKQGRKQWLPRYRVQAQLMLLLLVFTVATTLATGWILYRYVSEQAIEDAYANVEKIHFEKAFCRRDIGQRALAALSGE